MEPIDRDYVRELARRVAEIVASEENRTIIQSWHDVNALRPADRAPVWCRPWAPGRSCCPRRRYAARTPGCARWKSLRQILVKHDIGDNSPVDPTCAVAVLRRDLQEGTRRMRGCHLQIVLRELQTLAGHPGRLHSWTRLAKETAASSKQ